MSTTESITADPDVTDGDNPPSTAGTTSPMARRDNTAPPPNDAAPRRRVLMISCAFPPTGGPGVQRSAKFAKYLPANGWQPIVWAADRMPDLPHDPSLVKDLPAGIRVERRPLRDPRPWLQRLQTRAGIASRVAWRAERAWNRGLHRMLPDPMVHWALRSYRACRDLIDAEGIDVIYSTYSPASNHLLAWLLHGATGLPWVADFRDLWTDDYGYLYGNRLRRHADRWLEQRFIRSADAVIAVTDGQRKVLRQHDPGRPDKFFTISNGFDPADFEDLDRAEARRRLHGPADDFVLTFTGWFLSDRVTPALVEGIARMGAWARQQPGRFVLRIVGQIGDDMRRLLADAGVALETPGYLPHEEAIAHQAAADLLLLLVPQGPNGATLITGKIFEYLASGTPILLVAPAEDCEAARLLQRCGTGTRADHDAQSVFAAVRTLWLRWRAGDMPPGCATEHLAPVSRPRLAAQLAEVFAKTRLRR
ncbi:MAG TPA: glycosyltransferase [Phycisphaerae bacterium]|nr:glycosyltransferase [Phycisphaerae bacterium]